MNTQNKPQAFEVNNTAGRAYWEMGILWTMLATAVDRWRKSSKNIRWLRLIFDKVTTAKLSATEANSITSGTRCERIENDRYRQIHPTTVKQFLSTGS
jgi:hypothetical protein